MLNLSRRHFVVAAAFAAALGLDKRLAFINPAYAQKSPDPAVGFHKYKVGSVEVTALYDGGGEIDRYRIRSESIDRLPEQVHSKERAHQKHRNARRRLQAKTPASHFVTPGRPTRPCPPVESILSVNPKCSQLVWRRALRRLPSSR